MTKDTKYIEHILYHFGAAVQLNWPQDGTDDDRQEVVEIYQLAGAAQISLVTGSSRASDLLVEIKTREEGISFQVAPKFN